MRDTTLNMIKLIQQLRGVASKSARNKSTVWKGNTKEPLTEEQYRRIRDRHRPFVLGRDNVKRYFQPIEIPQDALKPREQLPFEIKRTINGHLPVYTEYKNGRNRVQTVVRRVEGDVSALREMLLKVMPHDHVDINPNTNHVIVKGNVSKTIRMWATAAGF
ncbi:hypothetical protein MP228_011426 [Amoeboaphelidium protococcarum]|nr:hypothetical protein MP228_011426 [Amoeboaphelidium protococcarum]